MKAYWDYIPKKDSELVAWSANFTAKVSAKAKDWEIPADEVAALQVADASYASLQKEVDSPARTAISVAEKNKARKVLEAKIRRLAGFRLKNPVITDAERISLGLHVRDTKPSAIPAPASRPELDVDVLDVRRLQIVFYDMGSVSKAKPYGVSGAVVAYAVLDAPPANSDALTRIVVATRTPHVLEFTEQERGKSVYLAICWLNRRGQRGPWSAIKSAIVP
jgi:hypothetical protein